FGEKLIFDAQSFEIEVDNNILSLPNPGTVMGLQATVQQVADRALYERREATGFAGQVLQQIRRQLRDEAPLQLDAIAEALATTPRTMQLRLKQHNTTFEKLVGDVRERLAEELLRDTNLPIGEIAHRLGFAEQSGFARWTKTHFQMPPSEFRERLRRSRTEH
ncbi:MAG: helix-turn-helix transcriptional regulator, partial [Hyphomicrobiaceae bacterium]|nr:helix-turn-helix transcriptional regulator [Hyphomicrobiaceae bacterium]